MDLTVIVAGGCGCRCDGCNRHCAHQPPSAITFSICFCGCGSCSPYRCGFTYALFGRNTAPALADRFTNLLLLLRLSSSAKDSGLSAVKAEGSRSTSPSYMSTVLHKYVVGRRWLGTGGGRAGHPLELGIEEHSCVPRCVTKNTGEK